MRGRWVAAVSVGALCGLCPASASAMVCTFDERTKTLTAELAPVDSALLQTTPDGHLSLTSTGDPAEWCEQHTVADTDAVRVIGRPGTSEHVGIIEYLHPLGPGATPERGPKKRTFSEVEVSIDLQGADPGFTYDSVSVDGSPGSDLLALGSDGLALNGDGDVDVTIAPTPRLTLSGRDGADEITGQGGFGSGAPYAGAEPLTIYGSASYGDSFDGDVLTGGNGADQLYGGWGADTLRGSAGDDGLWGFAGADTIEGGDGADSLGGDSGSDQLTAGAGNDFLYGGDDDDNLDAGDGDDTLEGNYGADTYRAGAGNDLLRTEDFAADALIDGGDGDNDIGFLDRYDSAINVENVYVY